MNSLLHKLARNGDISWLSYYFAEFISTQARTDIDDLTVVSAALVCEANQQGNVCIDLEDLSNRPLFSSSCIDTTQTPGAADRASWCAHLQNNLCVGGPNDLAPLTLDGSRLYLNRFWQYEDFVARKISAMTGGDKAANQSRVKAQVDLLCAASTDIDQDQKKAVLTAVSRPFSIISGGPGSGKTSTVVRILAVLLCLDPECRIALAAPTGKAAARMSASIRQRIDQVGINSKVKTAMPVEAKTIHRLLGYRHHRFDYDGQYQLAVDCVVIDEASMIDLKLMFHLLTALPQNARLILLGDRDQLASVAAGNVLGDITGHGHRLETSPNAIASSIALLGNNYRFGSDSAIGELAARVNQGQSDGAIALLKGDGKGLGWFEESGDQLFGDTLRWICSAYQAIFESDSPTDALLVHEKTRVLCATNQGTLGVESINQLISRSMLSRNNLPDSDQYSGLPIMITRNHYDLGLFNGDTGILWEYSGGLRACFGDDDGGIRVIAISRLPEFVPAWASTVHKSQGSEFDSVLLIFPSDPDSDVLNRELLYTAITRARRQFILHAPMGAIVRSVNNLTRRHSGLAQKLGWPDRVTPPG